MSYPDFLPHPIRDGYTGQVSSRRKAIQMEDGQYNRNRLWTSQFFRKTITWRMSPEQAQLFEAWLEYDVARGTGSFDLPFMGREVKVTPVTGVPSYSSDGFNWLISLEVKQLVDAPDIAPAGDLPMWPSNFPELEASGYSLAQTGAVTVSDIDAGDPQMRVRFRDRLATYSGTVILSPEERDQFWDFHNNTLINGHAYFLAPFESPNSTELKRARFTNSPSESSNGSYFNILLPLETMNIPLITYTQYLERTEGGEERYFEDGYIDLGYFGTS